MLTFIFILYTLVVTIMLLNIAIGLIGDTLERVQAQKDTLVLQIRAELLLQFQSTMSDKERFDPVLFPEWLHVIQREKNEQHQADEWLGRVATLKAEIEQVRSEQDATKKLVQSVG